MTERDLFLEKDMAWLRTAANLTYGDEVGDIVFYKLRERGFDFDTIWLKLKRAFLTANPEYLDYIESVDWSHSHDLVWQIRDEISERDVKGMYDILRDYQRSLSLLADSTCVPLEDRVRKLLNSRNSEASLACRLRARLCEIDDPQKSME